MTGHEPQSLAATLLLDCRNQLGEGIQWNCTDQLLYWTDIFGEMLWSCDANGGDPRSIPLPGKLCAFAFLPDQTLIAGFSDGLYHFDPQSGAREKMRGYEPSDPQVRTNDGNLDRAGNFVIGGIHEDSMAPTTPVWRWNGNGCETLLENIGCANSICFSPDGALMYFADSAGSAIYAHDYYTQGALGEARLFADIKGYGVPDGSTVDAEGYLWNARFGGRSVLRFTPEGHLDKVITLPVPNVTCCCIGGANLDRLFITTARVGMDAKALQQTPQAGGLFALDIPVKGLPHGQFIPQERTST